MLLNRFGELHSGTEIILYSCCRRPPTVKIDPGLDHQA